MLKIYLKSYLITISFIILFTFIVTILNYINFFNTNITNIIKILIPIISIFIGSFLIGKNSNQKGYIEGLKYGSIFIIFFVILNLILSNANFQIKSLLYYLILLIVSSIGGMFGINKKKTN